MELFAGAKKEDAFGHLVLCGLGGIFIEVLKDVQAGLAPLSHEEARGMIRRLKGYKILQGVRGQAGVNEEAFADVVVRLSACCTWRRKSSNSISILCLVHPRRLPLWTRASASSAEARIGTRRAAARPWSRREGP